MPTPANVVRDLVPGPRPLLLVPTAANMVRDLSSTRSETPLFVITAANMVRDIFRTRSEDLSSTGPRPPLTAYCSQHGPRTLKYPVRDGF